MFIWFLLPACCFAQELDGKYILTSDHAEYSESYTFFGFNQFKYSFVTDTFVKTYGEGSYLINNDKITFIFSEVIDFSEEISQGDRITILDKYYREDSLFYIIEAIDMSTGRQLVAAEIMLLDEDRNIIVNPENLDSLRRVIYKEKEVNFLLKKDVKPSYIMITPLKYSGYEIPISPDSSYYIRLEFNRLKFTYDYILSGNVKEFNYTFIDKSKFKIRKETHSEWKEFTKK